MKKLYIYTADKPEHPYSELSFTESALDNGLTVFAVFSSPLLETSYNSILRLINWGENPEDGTPVDGDSRSARVLSTQIHDAFLHLVNVPFECKKLIDTDFADDGTEATYKHGIKSVSISYQPSNETVIIK